MSARTFASRGRGGSLEPPGWTPPLKKGSRDETPQTNPETSQVSIAERGRGGEGAVPGGRMGGGGGGRGLEGDGGTYLR